MAKHYTAIDAPTIHHGRSRFDLSHGVKTSMNVGTLYPIYWQDIYPGDTFNIDTTFVSRLSSSFLRPVMDNLSIDIMYFFVPNRLVYDKWEQIFGENRDTAWVQPEAVSAPFTDQYTVIESKTVGDYFGLPLGNIPRGLQFLLPRAFAKIYDDWFRDENLISPMYINKGAYDYESEYFNNKDWSPSNYTGKLPKVAKRHDIFTSCLPSTQKASEPVKVPLLQKYAPVVANDPMASLHTIGDFRVNPAGGGAPARLFAASASGGVGALNYASSPESSFTDWNLVANLAEAGQINVTDMRYAFQLQRILERSSRCGSRYTEYLLSAFGVSSPDSRLQRAEYLGGKRMPLSVQQVAQTTRGDDESTELGSLGAFSLTNGKCGYHKGFVEHGFVIGVACIRQTVHTYQQGIDRFWQRKDRFDFYDPILANISEVPVYKSELFAPLKGDFDPKTDLTGEVFGYQEAWYDMRQRRSYVTGDMRSDSPTSFDIWHFADYYENAPTLNQQFINETPEYVDRTIAVPSTSADQFLIDVWHYQSAIRVLTPYSIPGLVDHH